MSSTLLSHARRVVSCCKLANGPQTARPQFATVRFSHPVVSRITSSPSSSCQASFTFNARQAHLPIRRTAPFSPVAAQSARMSVMAAAGAGTEVATLGGGCFWCLEACYQQLKGVLKVESGYAGGHVPNPTYEQVCGKKTGHTEVVQVTFDPNVISFKELLQVFFTIHDPTTLNRQGNDVGPQYRSAIYYHDEAQKAVVEEVIKEIVDEKLYSNPIVTEVAPLNGNYYSGEKYHQNYYNDNPFQGYCMFVVAPKVQKFRAKWAARLIK